MNDRLAALESAVDGLRSSVRHLEARLAHLEGQTASAGEPGDEAGAAGPNRSQPAPLPRPAAGAIHRGAVAHRPPLHRARRGVPAQGDDRHRRHPAGSRRGPRPCLRVGVARARRPGGRKGTAAQRRLPRRGRGDGGLPRGPRGDHRFKVFPGAASAAALAVLTAGILVVAWRRRLQPLAWIAVAVAVPASIVILAKTGVVVPHAVFLVLSAWRRCGWDTPSTGCSCAGPSPPRPTSWPSA